MIKNLTDKELIDIVTEIGELLEANDFNTKFIGPAASGYIDADEHRKEYNRLKARGSRHMAELYSRKIEVVEDSALEYAIQFI